MPKAEHAGIDLERLGEQMGEEKQTLLDKRRRSRTSRKPSRDRARPPKDRLAGARPELGHDERAGLTDDQRRPERRGHGEVWQACTTIRQGHHA